MGARGLQMVNANAAPGTACTFMMRFVGICDVEQFKGSEQETCRA